MLADSRIAPCLLLALLALMTFLDTAAATKTRRGCQCKDTFTYCGQTYTDGACGKLLSYSKRRWCEVVPGSCKKALPKGRTIDICKKTKKPAKSLDTQQVKAAAEEMSSLQPDQMTSPDAAGSPGTPVDSPTAMPTDSTPGTPSPQSPPPADDNPFSQSPASGSDGGTVPATPTSPMGGSSPYGSQGGRRSGGRRRNKRLPNTPSSPAPATGGQPSWFPPFPQYPTQSRQQYPQSQQYPQYQWYQQVQPTQPDQSGYQPSQRPPSAPGNMPTYNTPTQYSSQPAPESPPEPTPQYSPKPTPSATPSAPAPQGDIADALNAHNIRRRKHNAPDLSWDAGVAASAQSWANNCKFEHSKGSRNGENLAYTSGYSSSWEGIVKMWYDEISQYDFSKENNAFGTYHFTQVVWASTTKLGCGKQECPGLGTLFVCQYNPPGNYIGQFSQNVRPATGGGSSYRKLRKALL